MAATAWAVHDKIKEYVGNGEVNFDTDAFICNLYLVGSNANTVTTDAVATATNQHATANGYTQDNKAVANPSWTPSGSTITFDCDDVVWTASGGSILARFAAIYDDTVGPTPVTDPIVCSTLLDDTPGDVEATDTNTFTIAMNASGVFTLS